MANIDKGYVCEKTDAESQTSSSHARALENPSVNEKDVTSAEHDNNITPPQLIDIWEKIFSYLPYADLLQANAVCKVWRENAAKCFKRKSKLIISDDNFVEIYKHVGQTDSKYENVQVTFQWKNRKRGVMRLLNIFRHIGADIVCLDVCDLLTLSTLNGLLPKLKEIVLSYTEIPKGVQVDFNQFSELKSVVMCLPGLCPLSLSSNSNQPPEKRLKKLIINMESYPNDNINMLATLACSLHWLRFSYGKKYISRIYPQPEDIRLQKTFLNFTELTVLDLTHVSPKQVVRAILENLSENNQLNTIGLKERVETGLLELVGRKWSNSLQCIDYFCYKDTNIPVKIAQFATNKFRILWLSGPKDDYGWTNQDIQSAIPNANNKITQLYMVVCPRGRLFCELVQRLPNLTNLHLPPVSRISYKEMGYIFRHLIRLQQLTLPVCEGQADMEYLSSEPNVSNLKSLQMLASCLCPIKVLEILNLNFQFKELRELHVRFCQNADMTETCRYLSIFPCS